jgi:lycopene beta-cyclase
MSPACFDAILVGGGLQNGLVLMALLAQKPKLRVALVERAARLGGNHTWSFHGADLPHGSGAAAALAEAVMALVVAQCDEQEVHFPGFSRTLAEPYHVITGERLDQVLRARLDAAPGGALRLGTEVTLVRPGRVELESGDVLAAPLIVDARGPAVAVAQRGVGWQKFVGLEVELAGGVAPARPILMDATVEQLDGYRFLYVLPLGPGRALVEDTMYSDSPALAVDAVAARAFAYASARGLSIARVVRREHGVLPIPWRGGAGDAPLVADSAGVVVTGGAAGGWFHPTTGYTFPIAARLAATLAEAADGELVDRVRLLWAVHERRARFARLLNRMLFRHFSPGDRWRVLERFYRLPEDTVRRFYALEMSGVDRARIVCGRPPRGLRLAAQTREEVV